MNIKKNPAVPAAEPWAAHAAGPETPPPVILLRSLHFALHVLEGLTTAALLFPFLGRANRKRLTRRWAAGILRIFNIRVHIEGEAPAADAPNVVFVANHVSWLDPALIIALHPAHFVAKSEIRAWPALGWLAEKAGTIFIERHRRHDTARISRTLAEALRAGDGVGLFPEGTTTDGTTVKRFHASLLESAVQAEALLYPVALRYHHEDGAIDTAPAYTDNISFGASIRQVLARPAIHATVTFGSPIPTQGRHRRELAIAAEAAIRDALARAGRDRAPETPSRRPGEMR